MSAWASNDYTIAFGKQSAKGTAASSATYKLKVVDGSMSPARVLRQLAETDGSRQAGKKVVVGASVAGNPRVFLRPSDVGLLQYGLLGAKGVSGTNPYTHTMTQADSLPYFTIWENFGDVVITKFVDCQIIGGHFAGQSGAELTCGLDIVGLTGVFGTSDDVAAAVTEDPLVYPDLTVTKGGATPGTVDSFALDVTNGGGFVQGDSGITPNRYAIGKLEVSGTIVLLAESDADFRAFHTGTTSGTAFGRTLFAEAMDIKAAKSSSLYWEASLASVAYMEYPLAPDAAGNPLMVAMKFESQPDATVANYLSLIAKNAVVSY